MGAPYLGKLQVTFSIKNIELHSPGIWPQFKTDLFQNSLSRDIYYLHNVFQWLCIEKLKTTFHFLKEKKRKGNDYLPLFGSAVSRSAIFL